MESPDKIFRINSDNLEDFFDQWVEVLSHRIGRAAQTLKGLSDKQRKDLQNGLSPKRRKVLSELLKERYLLSFKVKDEELLDRMATNSETKKRIRIKCGMSSANFNSLISLFRNAKIIRTVDGVDKINPSFIPDISNKSITISFRFIINDKEEN